MTVQQFLSKLARGWWIILLLTLVGLSVSLFAGKQSGYISSITVGMNFNNQTPSLTPQKEVIKDQSYAILTNQLSTYLKGRFTSPVIEYKIGERMGLKVDSFDPKKTFYTVTDQNLGYVSLDFRTNNDKEGQKFIQAVKDTYSNEVISEWNNQRAVDYQIKPMTDFVSNTMPEHVATQTQILPVVIGLVLGLAGAVLLPNKIK